MAKKPVKKTAARKVAKKAVKKAAKTTKKKVVAKKVKKAPVKKATKAVKKVARPVAKKAEPAKKRASAVAKKPTRVAPEAMSAPRPSRGGSGLNAKDLEMFRALLEEKRAQLAGDVMALQDQAFGGADQASEQPRAPQHLADVGSDNFEQEFTLGLIEGERAVLQEIDDALRRIDEGSYGVCLATGRPIGKARLKAKPWAKYCYEYTLAQEKGQAGRF